MNKLMRIGLALSVVATLAAGEAFARGGGGRGGGRQAVQGGYGFSQYGYGAQAGAMQRQMMQYRYRLMQQQRLGDGSCAGQLGYGSQAGVMQWPAMQGRQGDRQSGFGGQNGIRQRQRLRDGSCGGQIDTMPRQMTQNPFGAGLSGQGDQVGGLQQRSRTRIRVPQ